MDRSSVGVSVRVHLTAVAGIVKVPVAAVELYILRHFLDAAECNALVALIDSNRKPSRLMTDHPDPEFRTSETCSLDPHDEVVRGVERKLTRVLGIAPGHGERLQGQRYAIGQQYKPHHDYLRRSEPYWKLQQRIGGQRTWTAMAYLNVPEGGGATYFPLLDLTLPPRLGSLVLWNNLDAHGEPNPATLHQGMPVTEGVKYIITKWYRERPWGLDRS